MGGEFDLLVPPLGGPVVTGDDAHPVQPPQVAVNKRVPSLGVLAGTVGEPEVPAGVSSQECDFRKAFCSSTRGWTLPQSLSSTYCPASIGRDDSALASFSPRSQHLAIYLVGEFEERRHGAALARLGPHKTGKGCLYIKRLDDVDTDALRELIDRSVRVRKGVDRASA